MGIGKVIKEIRLERGLSQIELAIHCNLTLTEMSQIETCAMVPDTRTVKALCKFFQVPEDAIYLLATEDSDIPESKKEIYTILLPTIKKLISDIFKIQQQISRQ